MILKLERWLWRTNGHILYAFQIFEYHFIAIWRHWTYKMPVRYILPSVWVIEKIYKLCLITITKSEVWTSIHCLGLGHETTVCTACLYILMNLWYLWVTSCNICVLALFVPNLAFCHWYICPSTCAWYECFPILLAHGDIPESGSVHSSCRLLPPEKTKLNRGWPRSQLETSKGAFELAHGPACIIG